MIFSEGQLSVDLGRECAQGIFSKADLGAPHIGHVCGGSRSAM